MWTRSELKQRGKLAFKANYWKCVLVSLILVILTGASSGGSAAGNSDEEGNSLMNALQTASQQTGISVGAIVGIVFGVIGVAFVIGLVISILVKNPFIVGCRSFYLNNSDAPANFGQIAAGFSKFGYGRVILTMFLRDLFIGIGFFLLIVPGVILTYSYRLVPYILAENPEISGMDALKMSADMMRGQKWNTFVLDLSFIGWMLLTIITCGIVGIFYVDPYMHATDAELYKAIRDHYNGNGTVNY